MPSDDGREVFASTNLGPLSGRDGEQYPKDGMRAGSIGRTPKIEDS